MTFINMQIKEISNGKTEQKTQQQSQGIHAVSPLALLSKAPSTSIKHKAMIRSIRCRGPPGPPLK